MITSRTLGQKLGLSQSTINKLARQGRIPAMILPSGHRRFDLEACRKALGADLALLLLDPAQWPPPADLAQKQD